jgi:cyclic pyranopterin phosphate synthase
MSDKKLTHIDEAGKASMIDVTAKTDTDRCAIASAQVRVSTELHDLLKRNALEKGDAIATARIAGIQAAKQTNRLIPLCHPLPLTHVAVDITLDVDEPVVYIRTEVKTSYKTGIEMEALTAASVAALTIYDMGKAVDKNIIIEYIRLEEKRGGKSGLWQRNDRSEKTSQN